MRFFSALLACLLLSTAALPQTGPTLEHKADLAFAGESERVITHAYVAGEDKLIFVGRKTAWVVDVAGAKLAEILPLRVPEFTEDRPRLVSPDGRRLLVFGNYGSAGKKEAPRPPTVWDLRTGEQVAALDKASRPIRWASWSGNGKTLVASSYGHAPYGADVTSVEVSFWDGETFAYKSTLPSDKISWSHLSEDGDRCFYTVGQVRNLWILDKYVARSGAPVNVWDVEGGRVVRTVAAREGGGEMKVRGVDVSPGDRFLALVVDPLKSNEAGRRLAVWEATPGDPAPEAIRLKYELAPAPKIPWYGVTFSPDGRHFMLDAGKALQIYETATGRKSHELPHESLIAHWADGGRILLFEHSKRLKAVELSTGRQLYLLPLISVWSSYTNDYGTEVNEPVDTTEIVLHPGGRLFLTYSNQYVKVFDSRTGELLQTPVSPPLDYSKKKPRPSDKRLVSKAGWSADGKTLYVVGADGRSVSLWGLAGN